MLYPSICQKTVKSLCTIFVLIEYMYKYQKVIQSVILWFGYRNFNTRDIKGHDTIKSTKNGFYSLCCKTVNAREHFWNVCFATNQMRDETAKDNQQTAEWNSHDLTWNNELAFFPWGIFNFTVFKYLNFSFSISALLLPKNRYERHFTEKRS